MSDEHQSSDYTNVDFRLSERFGEATPAKVGGLSQGGGGDGMDDLRVRVAVLEAHMQNLKSDVHDIKGDIRSGNDIARNMEARMSVLETQVRALPSKGYINKAVTTAIGLIGAFLLFQSQIQSLFGLSTMSP